MYQEKPRERRIRDVWREKQKTKKCLLRVSYSWYEIHTITNRDIGRSTSHNHTCGMCGHHRKNYGAAYSEKRRYLIENDEE